MRVDERGAQRVVAEQPGLGRVDVGERGGTDERVVEDGLVDVRDLTGVAQRSPVSDQCLEPWSGVTLDDPVQPVGVDRRFLHHDPVQLREVGGSPDERPDPPSEPGPSVGR